MILRWELHGRLEKNLIFVKHNSIDCKKTSILRTQKQQQNMQDKTLILTKSDFVYANFLFCLIIRTQTLNLGLLGHCPLGLTDKCLRPGYKVIT